MTIKVVINFEKYLRFPIFSIQQKFYQNRMKNECARKN